MSRLFIELWPEHADEAALEDDEPLLALLWDTEDHRIVLTSGRFVGARGFTLGKHDRVARLDEIDGDAIEAGGGRVELSLAWVGDDTALAAAAPAAVTPEALW